MAPYDPNWTGDEPPGYTSIIYHPGTGAWQSAPELVLMYERAALAACRRRIRLFDPPGRWALFGDLQVRWLDQPSFELAMKADAARRRELGWPGPAHTTDHGS